MESEVVAALIATPAVLVTAAAAWMAGRVQSRGAYHGPVDAVRRTAQREAYADLYRSARHFIDAHEVAEEAVSVQDSWGTTVRDMHRALDELEHAANMVKLEGPDTLADIADRIFESARGLGGQRVGVQTRTWTLNPDTPEQMRRRNEAMIMFRKAVDELLPTARQYLNGGPPQ
ncbi:hypothetical protein [Streptomyces ardesiacus]|uniref:hypothetical protein n=1 Tax=Streptomyces ardesiacus TaxID=285564 RepID=UPI00131F36C5|nr:hypothetical protein [Streptomyces ardesiacus]